MLSHAEMIGLQAEKHELVESKSFDTREEYVLHLIHQFAYTQATDLVRDKVVLDLGCNTGYGSEILARHARSVSGVDVSEQSIAIATEKHRLPNLDFQLTDGTSLPFDNSRFDVIISCQVIEHIVDTDVFFAELKRVLSPGGMVLLTTPNALLRLDPGMKPWNPFHVREFSASDLQALLSRYFSSVEVLGLDAREQTYRIEKARLDNARLRARRAQRPLNRLLRPAKSIAARFLGRRSDDRSESDARNPANPMNDYSQQHRLEDFFYRQADLETSLDLLAICSDRATATDGM